MRGEFDLVRSTLSPRISNEFDRTQRNSLLAMVSQIAVPHNAVAACERQRWWSPHINHRNGVHMAQQNQQQNSSNHQSANGRQDSNPRNQPDRSFGSQQEQHQDSSRQDRRSERASDIPGASRSSKSKTDHDQNLEANTPRSNLSPRRS